MEVELPAQAVDPVCGMSVDISAARFISNHAEGKVYFCAAGCQRVFESDPSAYLGT